MVSDANQTESQAPGNSIALSNFLREVITAWEEELGVGMFCTGLTNPSPCSSG